jgi:hypothetical protein
MPIMCILRPASGEAVRRGHHFVAAEQAFHESSTLVTDDLLEALRGFYDCENVAHIASDRMVHLKLRGSLNNVCTILFCREQIIGSVLGDPGVDLRELAN